MPRRRWTKLNWQRSEGPARASARPHARCSRAPSSSWQAGLPTQLLPHRQQKIPVSKRCIPPCRVAEVHQRYCCKVDTARRFAFRIEQASFGQAPQVTGCPEFGEFRLCSVSTICEAKAEGGIEEGKSRPVSQFLSLDYRQNFVEQLLVFFNSADKRWCLLTARLETEAAPWRGITLRIPGTLPDRGEHVVLVNCVRP